MSFPRKLPLNNCVMPWKSASYWLRASTKFDVANWITRWPIPWVIAGILLHGLEQGPVEERLARLEASLGLTAKTSRLQSEVGMQ